MKSKPIAAAIAGACLLPAALLMATPMFAQVAQLHSVGPVDITDTSAKYSEADADGRYVYLIDFAEPGLVERFRQARGSDERYDPRSPVVQSARAQLQAEQQSHIQGMNHAVRRTLDVTHRFLGTHSGVAVRLTPEEAATIARQSGVAAVERERVYEVSTYRGPTFINAHTLWNGSATADNVARTGAGMVAGVLDTGIDVLSPSFANDATCGHGTGSIPNKLIGAYDCGSTDGAGLCNGPGPADDNSHGSHVASTVAGNTIDNSASPFLAIPAAYDDMSGVAPCASVISYRVCVGGCPAADIQAGLNTALEHEVDVVNFSISGGNSPWADNDRRKLDLVNAGIFVAAAAGNNSADDPTTIGRVNHRGPWVMTVAASTREADGEGPGDVLGSFSYRGPTPAPLRDLQKPDITAPGVGIYAATVGFVLSVTGPDPVPEALQNIILDDGSESPIGSALIDHPIAFDPAYTPWLNPEAPPAEYADGCTAFPPNFFTGKVALIQRGGCNFAAKINNAAAAGAPLVLIWNNQAGGISMDTTGQVNVPAFSIGQTEGAALRQFIVDNDPGVTVTYAGERVGQFNYMGGTSMASPHIAGAALLVREARPGWTPSEVKSAMQMTAHKTGFQPNGTTPWNWDDVGSGRADLSGAALAGLVMDETYANYLAANPGQGGDVRTLNLAALRNLDCKPECTFTRTVRNTLDVPSEWSTSSSLNTGDFTVDVSPATFTFNGGAAETEELTITVTPVGDQSGAIHFGALVFTEAGGASPDLHWTLAFRGMEGEPAQAQFSAHALSFTVEDGDTQDRSLTISNLGDADLTYSITEAAVSNVVELGEPWEDRGDAGLPVELNIDGFVSSVSGIGVGGASFVWFNRFTPTALQLPFVLDRVRTLEFVGGSLNNQPGDIYDLYVWSDPDGDPTTGNEVLLTSVTGLVYGPASAWRTINLPAGIPIDASTGDVLIGLVNRTNRPETFPAVSAGSSAPSVQRSWIGFGFTGGAGNPPVFADAATFGLIDSLGAPQNWIIRGLGTGGSTCLTPSDVPWLTVTPAAGTIAGGDSAAVQVTVDTTSLSVGTHSANLCVATNDPNLPVAVVPLSVQVVGVGALPVADVDTTGLTFDLAGDEQDEDTLTIGNAGLPGAIDLVWSIETAQSSAAAARRAKAAVSGERALRGNAPRPVLSTGDGSIQVFADQIVGRSYDSLRGTAPTLSVAGKTSSGAYGSGDPGNSNVTLNIGVGNALLGLGYEVTVQSMIAGSWMADAAVGFATSSDAEDYVWLAPGGESTGGGTGTFSSEGVLMLADYDIAPVSASASGGLYFEWFEDFVEDETFGVVESAWSDPATGVVLPPGLRLICSDQAACDAAVSGGGAPAPNCDNPSSVSWLNVSPLGGSTAQGDSDEVTVSVDSDGLAEGTYEALLCVTTNDPNTPLSMVPVSLQVGAAPSASIEVTPASLSFQVAANQTGDDALVIDNVGTLPLDWTVLEAAAASSSAKVGGVPASFPAEMSASRSALPTSGIAPRRNPPANRAVAIDEGFENVAGLVANGWLSSNVSVPLGAASWAQCGGTAVPPAFDGGATDCALVNFNSTTGGTGTISNWLATPAITFTGSGASLSFVTRAPGAAGQWSDRLEIRLCTTGDCNDFGSGGTNVGGYTTLLKTINPNLAVGNDPTGENGYPLDWTQFTITDGLPTSGTGRIAFRYFVTNGGPDGSSSNIIGLDRVVVEAGGSAACSSPSDIPWLTLDTTSGTTNAGDSSTVNVSVNTAGMTGGETHQAMLCVESNDPANPVVAVPVSLEVTGSLGPDIFEDGFED